MVGASSWPIGTAVNRRKDGGGIKFDDFPHVFLHLPQNIVNQEKNYAILWNDFDMFN